MSKLTLNFFGDSISISRPKDLVSLRKEISVKFFLRPKDAEEIILSYVNKGKKFFISNEKDFKEFLKSKINKIDFDISEKSRIFEENLLKIKEENEQDQQILDELINKNKELENLKKTKFAEDQERIKNINLKIIFFSAMKKNIQKDVDEGIKSIEKEIKENEKKIKQLQNKLNISGSSKVPDFNKIAECKKIIQRRFDHRNNLTQAIKAKTKPLIGDLKINYEEEKTQTISWNSYINAKSYDIYHAESCYGEYTKIATVDGTSFTYELQSPNKYANYYKIAIAGSDQLSDPISAEIDLFGDNVHIFAPSDDREQIYNKINEIYKIQAAVDGSGNPTPGQQFGNGRHTFAFKSGDYSTMNADNYDISYYMQIIGLGKLPTDVKLKNIHVPAVLPDANVTCNFWMNIENFEVVPETVYHSDDVWFNLLWSVSQAAPARRLNVRRPTMLDWYYGWASGGFISDSYFEGAVGSYSQQQYYMRNCKLSKNWYGCNWNLVTQGVTGISTDNTYNLESGLGTSNWKSGKCYTFLNNTDLVREKPFLYFDNNEYYVFVPSLRTRSIGPSWTSSHMGDGQSFSINNDFYVAKANKDNATTINNALSQGKHILLTPGIYYAETPIKVERENTVILGLGLATIIPGQSNSDCAIRVSDVGGVIIAGVILDAQYSSNNMLVVGTKGSSASHSSNPVVLQDIFVRIGGVHDGVASTHQAVEINSDSCIGDDFWLWRADHGSGVGWNLNKAENGLVVNANNVIMYGLMVEHFQEYDIIWRGENGKTYFLQNEKCYDPQNQNDWKSHNNSLLGYAAYKVCNKVKNHYAVGLGSYDVFINTGGASIFLDNPYEVPDASGVRIENACIVEIANGSGPLVGFNHIINGVGPGTSTGQGGKGYARQCLISYNNTRALTIDDYYKHGSSESGIINTETGHQTSDDPKADEVSMKSKNDNIHSGVKCKGCGMFPIVGCRFKCNLCKNFNYCEKCEEKLAEEHNHPFIKIYNSEMENDYLI